MEERILFYRTNDRFGEFSNFSKHAVTLKSRRWPTSEHYFQAQKFAGTPHEEEVRLAATAMKAAQMGRERTRPLRADWDAVRDDIMREVVRAKFSQHRELRELLLSTGEAVLVEHTANDGYWADRGDGTGKNMLGVILMEIRSELREGKA
jgi:ribA/ribD-fused uncharacterized protein